MGLAVFHRAEAGNADAHIPFADGSIAQPMQKILSLSLQSRQAVPHRLAAIENKYNIYIAVYYTNAMTAARLFVQLPLSSHSGFGHPCPKVH